MVDITKQRIALIGGAGFIGHHLALELKKRGAEVVVIDGLGVNNLLNFLSGRNPGQEFYLNLINQRLSLLRGWRIPLIVQDARDYPGLTKVLNEFNPTVVVHLAAVAHANVSNKDPYSTFDHSLRTLENVLDKLRGTNTHLVYFSSSMIYGNFPDGYVSEDTPCEPLGVYGALKMAGERMVIAYNQAFDLPYTIVRPSALYGERCVSRRVGQIFIENAIKGLKIKVAGDGGDRLDFTYVRDLVQGVVKVIEREESRNQTFNLTYGESRSIAQMAEIINRHFPEVAIEYQPRDKLTPARGTLSVEKARRLIGYEPQFPLERGFVEYISWYKNVIGSAISTDEIQETKVIVRPMLDLGGGLPSELMEEEEEETLVPNLENPN